MANDPLASFRLATRIKSAVERQGKRDELSFSDICRVLLKAYAKGDITITVLSKQKKKITHTKPKKKK